MQQNWRGGRAFLLAQLVRLVEQFIRSDRISKRRLWELQSCGVPGDPERLRLLAFSLFGAGAAARGSMEATSFRDNRAALAS